MCFFAAAAPVVGAEMIMATEAFVAADAITAATAAESAWSFGGMWSAIEGAMSSPWMTGLQLGGKVLEAYSSGEAARANRDAAAYRASMERNNAMVAEWQAQDAEYRGQQAVEEHQRKVAALKGTQTASMAARGLDLSEGTPLNILTDTDMLGAMDVSTIKQNAAKEAWAHRASASNSTAQAGLYEMQRNNSPSPFMAGAGSLMSGIGSVADKWYRAKTGNPSLSLSA